MLATVETIPALIPMHEERPICRLAAQLGDVAAQGIEVRVMLKAWAELNMPEQFGFKLAEKLPARVDEKRIAGLGWRGRISAHRGKR